MRFIILSGAVLLSLPSVNVLAATKVSYNKVNKNHSQSLVNLNKVGAEEMRHAYKGMSMRRAKAIVNFRSKNGPFKTLADLIQVKGIGKSYMKRNLSALKKIFSVSP